MAGSDGVGAEPSRKTDREFPGPGDEVKQRLLSYLDWANSLCQDTQRLTNEMVSLELRQRVDAFQVAAGVFGRQLMLRQQRGQPVVADSSFYIEYPQKLEEVNFTLTGRWPG